MPIAAKNKKNFQQKPIQGPLIASNHVLQQREGLGLSCVGSKTELVVEAALDRSKPSPTFASNDIHTKIEANNLQGNGLIKGPGASQVPIRRGSQKPGSLKL